MKTKKMGKKLKKKNDKNKNLKDTIPNPDQ